MPTPGASDEATGSGVRSDPGPLTLGVNTCFAVKRWPEPRRWASIVVDELGLADCQVTLDLFDPSLEPDAVGPYADMVRTEATAAGLTVHSTFTGLAAYSQNLLLHPDQQARESAEAWLRRAVDLSSRIGARGAGGYVGAMSAADADDPARRELLLSALRRSMERLSDHAARAGLEFLLFENMAVEREFGHTIDEALDLEAWADGDGSGAPWKLCLDLGHPCALRTGGPSDDPLAWIESPWRRDPVFQIQQANRDGDHHWPFTPERNQEGLLDAREVVGTLRRRRPQDEVHLFLEVIHPPECPDDRVLDDLRASVAYWRDALATLPGRGSPDRPAQDDTRVHR